MSQNERTATDFFVGATRHLVEAEAAAGVRRHVVLSIVGIDEVPTGYYKAKLAQERAARAGAVPVSVVRATQFHDFPGQILSVTAKGPVAVVPSIPVQPVSTHDVAKALLDAAEAPEAPELLQIGGPEERDLVDLARRTLEARGRRAMVLRLRVPGAAGRAMRSGGLLLKQGRKGSERFEDWLAASR
jgi:nucleoside-diphosphate-sugar epimerase